MVVYDLSSYDKVTLGRIDHQSPILIGPYAWMRLLVAPVLLQTADPAVWRASWRNIVPYIVWWAEDHTFSRLDGGFAAEGYAICGYDYEVIE